MTHQTLQNQIDAAHDCDQPELAERLDMELKALGPWPVEAVAVNPYANFMDANGNIDTASIFGVK